MRDYSNEPELHILAVLHRLEMPTLAVVSTIAIGVLLLWLSPRQGSELLDGWSRMVPATALTLLAAVASLALSKPRSSRGSLRASRLIGYIVAAVGVATLLVYALGYHQPANALARASAPQSALAFILLGAICSTIRSREGLTSFASDLCTVALIGIILFLFAGYIFFVDAFVGVSTSNITAPHTLLCLALLTFVAIARRAQEGRMFAVLIGRGIGSHILRLVLPVIIFAPFLIFGVIGYFDGHGVLSASFSRALAAPVEALAIIGFVAWMAKHTNNLERELRRLSITDELTGVLNRRGFFAVADYAMRNALRTRTPLTLFYFDLDGLKEANDRFGHDVGSQVIGRFARLLSRSFRTGDIVARIGGDEFVVLANGGVANADGLIRRLQDAVAAHNQTGRLPVAIAYSSGHIEVPNAPDVSIDQVITEADALMYKQKQLKRQAA
jgi:diguanylate cyclase (GGDEF)-like protein